MGYYFSGGKNLPGFNTIINKRAPAVRLFLFTKSYA